MKCPYCGRAVAPEHKGKCPKCKAAVPVEVKKPEKTKEEK